MQNILTILLGNALIGFRIMQKNITSLKLWIPFTDKLMLGMFRNIFTFYSYNFYTKLYCTIYIIVLVKKERKLYLGKVCLNVLFIVPELFINFCWTISFWIIFYYINIGCTMQLHIFLSIWKYICFKMEMTVLRFQLSPKQLK